MHLRVGLLLGGFACIAAPNAFAKTTVEVGSCNPTLVSFNTISAAISHSPAGATIDICPGTYPEQITISKNLTLIGVTSGNSSQASLVFPSSGAVVNATDLDGGTPTAAQILVTGPASVTIENLTINGAANNVTTCATDVVGILYQNASGTIHGNNVLNQIQPSGYTGCQGGLGIYVESSSGTSGVTISANVVSNYQKNGITADDTGTNATITTNYVLGVGPTTGAAENAIQIAYGATATISGNTVGDNIWAPDTSSDTGDAAAGILVYGSANVQITGNVVGSTQYGIAVVGNGAGSGDGANISTNRITNTEIFDAIDVCGAGSATINSNTISGAVESGIHLDSSCGSASTGNTVSGNHVNGTCAAVLEGTGSAGTVSTLTATNAAYLTLTGSDQCPVATSTMVPRARAHGRFSPFR